jgi:hypothetical protein
MILKKKTSMGGAFARKKAYDYEGKSYEADIKDGDLVKILTEGETAQGEFGEQFVVKIETRNGEKNLALNQTSVNNLVDAFGEDSANFVGKTAKVWVIKAMVSGKLQNVAYLAHPGAIMDDDGSFRYETGATGAVAPDAVPDFDAIK